MTDTITLTGLRVDAFHGVFESEARHGQEFVVDLTLAVDLRPAAASDRLADTVDYGALAEAVVAAVGAERNNLIEAVAGRIADTVMGDERIEAVTVTVHKPHAPLDVVFEDVAVTISRTR